MCGCVFFSQTGMSVTIELELQTDDFQLETVVGNWNSITNIKWKWKELFCLVSRVIKTHPVQQQNSVEDEMAL